MSEYEVIVKENKNVLASEIRQLQKTSKNVPFIDDIFVTFIDFRSVQLIKDIYNLNLLQRICCYLICQCDKLRKYE